MIKQKKVLFISSSQHFTEMFLKDFFEFLPDNYQISLITNLESKISLPKKVYLYNVNISRKINILNDFFSALRILFFTLKIRPSFVITTTPKCTIFGSLIKLFFPGIKRIHIYTGITWTNMIGLKKKLFIKIDKLNIFFSTKVLFDSKEQIYFLSDNGFNQSKFYLINNGSIKGVNSNIFFKYDLNKRNILRKRYNITPSSKVILYMGRMDKEKGILYLLDSFKNIANNYKNILLLLVGKDEMQISSKLKLEYSAIRKKIIYINHNSSPEEIYNLADIFCLPSTREGFGNVVIESSAVEIPVVGSDIYGLRSSLVNELNGLTFKKNETQDLTEKLIFLIENEHIRKKLGENGRNFVKQYFNHKEVNSSLEKLIFS